MSGESTKHAHLGQFVLQFGGVTLSLGSQLLSDACIVGGELACLQLLFLAHDSELEVFVFALVLQLSRKVLCVWMRPDHHLPRRVRRRQKCCLKSEGGVRLPRTLACGVRREERLAAFVIDRLCCVCCIAPSSPPLVTSHSACSMCSWRHSFHSHGMQGMSAYHP